MIAQPPLTGDGAPERASTIIGRRSLHDELVPRLRDMIVEEELKPGERISERLLCERFGISRTPLREALKVLASEGLIVLTPNRGAVVARPTAKDVRGMLEVMGALEMLAGELAANLATDDDIERIRNYHRDMLAEYAKGEILAYFKLNQRIHESIAALAGNVTLSAFHATLGARMKRIRFIGNRKPGRWRESIREHEAVLAALEKRDGPLLGSLLREHMRQTWLVIASQIDSATD
jgi:DNA-binding GntR family transcriptional regulator